MGSEMCIRDSMLVEDNELNAEVAEILLEDEGAIITMVNDGQQKLSQRYL